MHGAYKATARDFDGDGDYDVAAISYYPEFDAAMPESFVYLENQGAMKFVASTVAEQNAGRWMVMDSGDVDGDGDPDVVLGSFVRGPTTVPVSLAQRESWRTNGAALLLLENVRK
ncbi:MAG: VCBS repeat-containing protein [Verrucomicrobia bacterium]|nr:VCBS repeat-containing protein [Verrucomicrobiota bacterium]